MSIRDREAQLLDFLQGTLSPREKQELEAHLASCDECREALAAAKRGEELFRAMLVNPSPDFSDRILRVTRDRPILPSEETIGSASGTGSGSGPVLPGFFSRPEAWFGGLALVLLLVAGVMFSSRFFGAGSSGIAPSSPGTIAGEAPVAVPVAVATATRAGDVSVRVATGAGTATATGLPLPPSATLGISPGVNPGASAGAEVAATVEIPGASTSLEEIGRVMRVSGTWEGNPGPKPRFFSGGTAFSTGADGYIELAVPRWGGLWLGSSSACVVDPDALRLASGSAWFNVASRSSDAPFRVICSGHTIEAAGARFGVTALPDGIARVFLFEGVLRLNVSDGTIGELAAGKVARLDRGGIHRSGSTREDLAFWQTISGDLRLALPNVPGTASHPAGLASIPSAPASQAPILPASMPASTLDPNEPADFIRYLLQRQQEASGTP